LEGATEKERRRNDVDRVSVQEPTQTAGKFPAAGRDRQLIEEAVSAFVKSLLPCEEASGNRLVIIKEDEEWKVELTRMQLRAIPGLRRTCIIARNASFNWVQGKIRATIVGLGGRACLCSGAYRRDDKLPRQELAQ
jgi:hypothetical protein